ncbi:MAG: hypothetical protein ICV78_21785 [Tolypothrix sp. Co-bin9]|nr:hypothetical protein [Tolypothrix sp. Co-bin9]
MGIGHWALGIGHWALVLTDLWRVSAALNYRGAEVSRSIGLFPLPFPFFKLLLPTNHYPLTTNYYTRGNYGS